MGIGSTISARFGNNPYGIGGIYPFLWRECESVQSGFLFNPLEFEGVELGII